MKITRESSKKEVKRLIKKRCYRKALDIVRRFKVSNVTITKRSLKEKFKLSERQIKKLNFIEVDNPYYKCAGAMRLYLTDEVIYKLKNNKL
jgi:ribosomal protein L4